MNERQRLFDGFAIGASALCLIHCLVLPALLILIPAFATFLTLRDEFHLGVFVVAVPISAIALMIGYSRHRQLWPSLIALPGLISLALGTLAAPAEWAEEALPVLGAVLLVVGHIFNWRMLRR